jgi:hypothetical protein
MVQIQLNVFNNALAVAVTYVNPSGVVRIQVSLSNFQNTFRIKTSDATLANPTTNTNMRYYVDRTQNTSKYSFFASNTAERLNPAYGKVVRNPATFVDASGDLLSDRELALVNDFVRHLALQEFENAQLTYLFTNTALLQQSIISNMQTVSSTLQTYLSSFDKTVGTSILSDADGKYATNAQVNVCRALFLAMNHQVPNRFDALQANVLTNLPFEEGDSITFHVLMDNSLQEPSANNRSYIVELVMASQPVNAGYDTFI